MNGREWLTAYAKALHISPPLDDEIEGLLKLAAEAAHSSERTAAPVACWLAARAGYAPAEALAIAEGLRASE